MKDVEINLRRARPADYEKVIWVESKSTPNLRYIPYVFEEFVSDEEGEFSVAEIEGEIVGCGKFTVLPDGSAWLETLRVIPEKQGLGVGKRFYERFHDNARCHNIKTMRMYTGVKNVVSKGLAERYGLELAESFRGVKMPCEKSTYSDIEFIEVTNVQKADKLISKHSEDWGGFLVMNRTFYKISSELISHLVKRGMVYIDPETDSVIVVGARFMPWKELHIGLFGGDTSRCLSFALNKGLARGVNSLNCLFPSNSSSIEGKVLRSGFNLEPADFIVMETHLE